MEKTVPYYTSSVSPTSAHGESMIHNVNSCDRLNGTPAGRLNGCEEPHSADQHYKSGITEPRERVLQVGDTGKNFKLFQKLLIGR